MKRLYYILIMITVGMFASCSLSFDSFIDEEDADLANNGDGFTAPRHIKNETGTATYQFHENVVWLNHDDYNGYLIEIKDSLISFASSMPVELLPNPGDVVYHAADDRFGGIAIEAERVFKDGDRFKCIGNNVDGTRVFKVLKVDMKSDYQGYDDAPSDITRATDMKKTFIDTTYTHEIKLTQTSTDGYFIPIKFTGRFELAIKLSQRLKETFDIHIDSDKDEFRLGLDSYVKTIFTKTVSANGTVEIRWAGPISIETPSVISVPTIPIPIIPKIVSVELAYQYETKNGYANYKETSTDTNESWYGFEIGVEPGSIKPYFKERDNRSKTKSKYETSGYKDLDESRHTFSVKMVGLSIPGFSVFEKGVGISYINRKEYDNNLSCYLRDPNPSDKISLPLPLYKVVRGNDRTGYTHALDIFLRSDRLHRPHPDRPVLGRQPVVELGHRFGLRGRCGGPVLQEAGPAGGRIRQEESGRFCSRQHRGAPDRLDRGGPRAGHPDLCRARQEGLCTGCICRRLQHHHCCGGGRPAGAGLYQDHRQERLSGSGVIPA